MELVNKLKQLGLLGDELLHTTNGKEYITKEQVAREVKQAVAEAGGRIPLVSMACSIALQGGRGKCCCQSAVTAADWEAGAGKESSGRQTR